MVFPVIFLYLSYRYVFSTGATIDSLSVSGNVSDALERETPDFVSVLLHEVDSTYTDSIIFKQKPKYIGISDSLSQFSIDNLKARSINSTQKSKIMTEKSKIKMIRCISSKCSSSIKRIRMIKVLNFE